MSIQGTSIQATIEKKLTETFSPERLSVVNESHLHAGHHHVDGGHHATFDGTGETHFRVRIVSPAKSARVFTSATPIRTRS